MIPSAKEPSEPILQSMRGKWEVTPAVAVNRDRDVIHRVVGYPGIILVSEGPGNRVQRMLVAERKRVQRVAMDVPVYDIQCGDGDGQVPLRKLSRHVMKLPRNLKKPALSEVNFRLRAPPQALPVPFIAVAHYALWVVVSLAILASAF